MPQAEDELRINLHDPRTVPHEGNPDAERPRQEIVRFQPQQYPEDVPGRPQQLTWHGLRITHLTYPATCTIGVAPTVVGA